MKTKGINNFKTKDNLHSWRGSAGHQIAEEQQGPLTYLGSKKIEDEKG